MAPPQSSVMSKCVKVLKREGGSPKQGWAILGFGEVQAQK